MKRVLTALVLIPLVIALVLWAPGGLFLLGLLPFVLLALGEYLELAARLGGLPQPGPVHVASVLLLLVAHAHFEHLLFALLFCAAVLLTQEMFRRPGLPGVLPAAAAACFGLLYVALPFALVVDLRESSRGRLAVLFVVILVWVGDTAAYYGGRAVGRRKLAPHLSPGKTVEGTVASFLASVAVGFWLFRTWFPDMPEAHAGILPAVVNVAGQLGDLTESALKRGAGVKDSSVLLPGHGGMLDRIDALLFALPVMWYYWAFLTLRF